jgi:hypothetical protein
MSIINVNTIQPIGAGQTVTVNGRINGYNLPSSGDAAGAILGTDGSGNLSWVNGRMVLETSKASTSGTSIDFTGIPSWVKRITVMFNGVSTNGTSLLVVRLGTSGGIVSSGYTGSASSHGATVATQTWTSGFGLRGATTAAADIYRGQMVCSLLDASNTWVSAHSMALSNTAVTLSGAGTISLGGTLDRLRITTGNGTDTFDAGSINLLLEG